MLCLFLSVVAAGCADDICVDKDSLTAQFSFEKSFYLTNEEVFIRNTTQGGSGKYEYEWDFGDGRTSSEAEPHLMFNEIGAYTITLNVRDSKGPSPLSSAFSRRKFRLPTLVTILSRPFFAASINSALKFKGLL